MNEELKNNDVMELVEVEETYEPELEEFEESSGILKKVAVGVGAVTVGAIGALVVKNRDKLKSWKEERMIRKLEKKGYEVYDPNDYLEEEFEEVEDFVEEVEEEQK